MTIHFVAERPERWQPSFGRRKNPSTSGSFAATIPMSLCSAKVLRVDQAGALPAC